MYRRITALRALYIVRRLYYPYVTWYKQYVMSALFLGNAVKRERQFNAHVTVWTAFSSIKHITQPAIDCGAFSLIRWASSMYASPTVASPITNIAQRLATSAGQARRRVYQIYTPTFTQTPISDDYSSRPFRDREYGVLWIVTNNTINTNIPR